MPSITIHSAMLADSWSNESDSDFDFEDALASDPSALFSEFVGEWVSSLTRENVYSLAMLLMHMLHEEFQIFIIPASKGICTKCLKTVELIFRMTVKFPL